MKLVYKVTTGKPYKVRTLKYDIQDSKIKEYINRNALIRYKTIDNCLRNPYRRWTLEDLVDACSDALYW